jgi:hypothetical protein
MPEDQDIPPERGCDKADPADTRPREDRLFDNHAEY